MSARRIAIIGTVVVGIAALVGAVAYFMPIFKVQNFSIRGQHNTSVEDIQSATHISIGANLMRIDAPSAAHSVAQLPWVDKATVTREFPNTVDVEVQERTAALYVKRDDGEHLIDEKGKPFIIDAPPEGTVEITETNEDDQKLFADAISVLKSLDDTSRAAVARIKAPSQYEFSLITHDDREIYWGAPENNHDKAVATKTVLQREGAYWNVSAPGLVTTR